MACDRHETSPRVCYAHVGVLHAGTHGTGWHIGESPFSNVFLALLVVWVTGN